MRPAPGPPCSAPAKKSAAGEVAGIGHPDCKRPECQESGREGTARTGGAWRHERSACGRSPSGCPVFGPTWRGPGTIAGSSGMRCRGLSAGRSAAAEWACGRRRMKGRPLPGGTDTHRTGGGACGRRRMKGRPLPSIASARAERRTAAIASVVHAALPRFAGGSAAVRPGGRCLAAPGVRVRWKPSSRRLLSPCGARNAASPP